MPGCSLCLQTFSFDQIVELATPGESRHDSQVSQDEKVTIRLDGSLYTLKFSAWSQTCNLISVFNNDSFNLIHRFHQCQ